MKYLTIIQTRTGFSRLPAKCFLPLANMPLSFKPKTNLKEGLIKTYQDYLKFYANV